MAHTDWDHLSGKDPYASDTPPGCQADDLKTLLHTIVEQLTDADRRQSDTLMQMQDRLAVMGSEARSLRARVPNQFAGAFERIEAGMAELASRIADASEGATRTKASHEQHVYAAADPAPRATPVSAANVEVPMALRSASETPTQAARRREEETSRHHGAVDTFDVIESSLPGNVTDPWDRDAAEALTGLYESGGASFANSMPSTNPQAPGPRNYVSTPFPAAAAAPVAATAIDTMWLDARFAELTKHLNESLAEIRPDQGFFDISQRIEQVERHVANVLDTVATRTDVEGIRLIEAHVGELAGHLDGAHQQLLRLDTIESHLNDIADKLSDVHRAAMSSDGGSAVPLAGQADIDVEAIANRAADAAASRIVAQLPRPQGGDEVRGLIERFMAESRLGDENTSALLDTLQQAMIRLLDRVDAMEMSHHQSLQAQSAPQEYVREQVRFSIDPHRAHAYAEQEPTGALDAAVAAVASAKSMSSPFSQAPGTLDDAAPQSAAVTAATRSPDKLRQDFIADARRAKMRLAGETDDGNVVITKPEGTVMAAAAKPQRPVAAAAPKAKSAAATTTVPRLMVMGLAALSAVGGLWFTLNGGAPSEPVVTGEKPAQSAPFKSSTSSAQQEPRSNKEARSDANAADQGTSAAGTAGAGQPESATPELNIQEGTHGEIIPGDISVGSASIPLMGIAVDTEKPVTAAELQRAKRQQAMAAMSGRLGQAAADAAYPGAVPAALIPDQDGAEGLAGAPGQTLIQKNMQSMGMTQSSALDLPPASVGPLSLRLAAANGDPSAQFQVGSRLAEGKGNAQNFADAAKWYQRAASNGFAQAQYRLGTLYERGLGIKADPARAESWYKQAADLGNIKAMHNLAVMSANQNRSSPDYMTAAKWFSQAAERGLSDSQFNLAVLHENGLGVPQDLSQAYKWLVIAARSDDKEAVRRRDILRGKLTAEDIASAETLISQWRAKPADPLANDARSAGEAWKKNPANGVSG